MAKEMDSCVQTAAGPLAETPAPAQKELLPREVPNMAVARVGGKAPDFEASAYVASEGFKNIKLSNYHGRWVVLCFYPGDFTFV